MLTHPEIRVLGCLIEKQLATPQHYPLTESALVAACNQATNRDPVVDYDVNVVRRALTALRAHGLAREVRRPGERTAKHRHLVDEALELDESEAAVLAVLLLRGPQTAAELRARTERLHRFSSVAAVEEVLSALADRSGGALVARQERRPGQKETRVTHLLLDPDAEDAPGARVGGAPGARVGEEGPRGLSLVELSATVTALQEEVAALRAEVAALRAGREGGAAGG